MQARSFQVRRQTVDAILHVLADDPLCPDGLAEAIAAGDPIDLDASRVVDPELDDGQPATIGGYLLGLCRDKFANASLDWREFVALGSLAADIG